MIYPSPRSEKREVNEREVENKNGQARERERVDTWKPLWHGDAMSKRPACVALNEVTRRATAADRPTDERRQPKNNNNNNTKNERTNEQASEHDTGQDSTKTTLIYKYKTDFF